MPHVLASGGAGFLGGMLRRLLHQSRNNAGSIFIDTAQVRSQQAWSVRLICERVQVSAIARADASRTGKAAQYFTGSAPRLSARSGY